MTALIAVLIIAALVAGHHAGHAHANYRYYRAQGRRGIDLFWSSARGPYVSIPVAGGFRIGHAVPRSLVRLALGSAAVVIALAVLIVARGHL